ncbi:MAG: AAA family ATPase [Bacilli bacterium]|nr:AAA family ATPase [Bacilli bacterium]
MVYLKEFKLLDDVQEHFMLLNELRIYEGNYYPFGLFSYKDFKNIRFEPITIFYGGNGSGKTTLLNIITEKVMASRSGRVDKGMLFRKYADACECEIFHRYDCKEFKFITSDDVFDYLLDVRAINSGVNRQKEDLALGYITTRYGQKGAFDDYQDLKERVSARRQTKSAFIRSKLINNNITEHSNGETALMFWQNEIKDHSVYILDEPENSLSAENQLKLVKFIEESARFYDCQFIISSHSPFILSLQDALIYDLDENPVITKKWNELKNVQVYHDFFKEHEEDFNK